MKPRVLLLALVSVSSPSLAQPSASESAAELLFREGRQLLLDDKPREACPRLAESLRLDPGDGTRLLLAQCYERVGKTASAWRLYTEVIDSSRKRGNADYLRVATGKLDRLTPRLPRIVLNIPAKTASIEGFELRLDGVKLGAETSGVAIPVDPGTHALSVSAPGHQSLSLEVTGVASETTSVSIPELLPIPAPPPSASAPVAPSSSLAPVPTRPEPPPTPGPRRRPWQPAAGYATVGVGAVGLLVGAYFLRQSLQQRDQADGRCPGLDCADPGAVSLSQQAVRSGNLATLFLGSGLVLAGAGAALLLTAPPTSPASAARPGSGAMISWRGRF